MSDAGLVNIQNAQRGGYAQVISKIAEENICPFCPEHLSRIHPNPLDERKYWIITDNAYPYHPVRHHLLLIHKEHIAHATEISVEAWTELREIICEVSEQRGLVGGALVMRFGDSRFTGASVTHLHAQLVQGDPDHAEYDSKLGVRCRVG